MDVWTCSASKIKDMLAMDGRVCRSSVDPKATLKIDMDVCSSGDSKTYGFIGDGVDELPPKLFNTVEDHGIKRRP
jgi:hypothetical protein